MIPPEQIINQKISRLQPCFMEGYYEQVISSFYQNGSTFEETLKSKQNIDFFFNGQGYIKLFLSNLKLIPAFSDGILLALFLTPAKASDGYNGIIVYDQNTGDIYGFNKQLFLTYGLQPQFLKIDEEFGTHAMNMRALLPELMSTEIYDCL